MLVFYIGFIVMIFIFFFDDFVHRQSMIYNDDRLEL